MESRRINKVITVHPEGSLKKKYKTIEVTSSKTLKSVSDRTLCRPTLCRSPASQRVLVLRSTVCRRWCDECCREYFFVIRGVFHRGLLRKSNKPGTNNYSRLTRQMKTPDVIVSLIITDSTYFVKEPPTNTLISETGETVSQVTKGSFSLFFNIKRGL